MISFKEYGKYNAGDVAEGIFTFACVARFIHKEGDIDAQDIKDIINRLVKEKSRTTKDTVSAVWKVPNLNSATKDTIKLTVRLAESNLNALLSDVIFKETKKFNPIISAALHYANQENIKQIANFIYTNNQENVMEFVADGIGNQKGTKQDVYVKISGPNGKSELNLSVSLKAGAVKQFGQIGGSQPEKQQSLWELFGFNIPKSVLDDYTEHYSAGKIKEAVIKSYTELAKAINKEPNYNASSTPPPKNSLKAAIIHFMVGAEEDIELVQLDKQSKSYQPKTLMFPNSISAEMKKTGVWPEIIITTTKNGKKMDILRVRCKAENRTGYIRNYIEKGPDLYEMQVK